MATSTTSDTRLNVITRRVRLRGLTPIMFDRYAGDNQTKLTWDQKIYLRPGTNELVLPALNIIFCSIQGADGDVENITFTRDGKPITVGAFGDRSEPQSGLHLHRAVARLDKGIPNPKERPVLPLPWALEFDLTIYPNKEIKEQEIKNLLAEGGMAIRLGTFRGVFGKFEIEQWD